ncbi:DUF998 domain-containing protein [Agromyces sp. S2-1-8]|uniref:DUF998 domain-containing protein n=1 Tax=unclassified Agromyces TaxID=2639701 RepID=UPI001E2C991E|nr:DUF998 domain-containing protein [Agromyces sp. S2-1-8]MCD5346960.1 DUF998 domain-containing protein [Agromyces sp. S2-1-8]
MDTRIDRSSAEPGETADRRRAARAGDPATRGLVAAGVVAGPLFVVVGVAQVLTREGFDLARHPLSLLSLGDLGWVQIANFVIAGVLMLAFAAGARRSLGDGPGRIAAPVLFALYGVGLVLGGAFTADPALGFPAGAPAGTPTELTLHGWLHAFAAPLAFLALVAATWVVARRLAWEGHRAAAAWSRVIGVACLVLCVPFGPGMSVRLLLGVALGFAWIAAYAISLLRPPMTEDV